MNMKKDYIAPSVVMVCSHGENLLYTASPGIGGDYEDDMPIDAKIGIFDDSDEWELPKPVDLWSEDEE